MPNNVNGKQPFLQYDVVRFLPIIVISLNYAVLGAARKRTLQIREF